MGPGCKGRMGAVIVASPVTSLLAHVHGTGVIHRRGLRIPTSGVGGRVTRVLGHRNFMHSIRLVRSGGRNVVHVFLGCNSGGRHIVANLGHVDGPNLHMCTGTSRMPHMLGNLKVTLISASRKILASGRTHTGRINKRMLTCI